MELTKGAYERMGREFFHLFASFSGGETICSQISKLPGFLKHKPSRDILQYCLFEQRQCHRCQNDKDISLAYVYTPTTVYVVSIDGTEEYWKADWEARGYPPLFIVEGFHFILRFYCRTCSRWSFLPFSSAPKEEGEEIEARLVEHLKIILEDMGVSYSECLQLRGRSQDHCRE